ncbi:MAG TPA: hypothetical protein VFZ47_11365, partial [Chitinophagaceae bacterium]
DTELWRKLVATGPATDKNVPDGSPEMAREIQRLFREEDMRKHSAFAMAGHENGVISFGSTLEEAWEALQIHFVFP